MTSRRKLFAGAGALGGGVLASLCFANRVPAAAPPAPSPQRSFRFVHFGDTHVGNTIPFSLSSDGYPKALRHVHALEDAPDFILHTGDIITDAFWATRESAATQWEAWRKVMKEHCTLPVRYTLGNHDVNFGWDRGDGTKFPGKSLALEQTGLACPYYSFDHKGWHFIVLDNTQPGGWNGFQILLDDPQAAWLEEDLKRNPPEVPVIVATHAPIICVACFFEPLSKKHPDGMVISNDCVHQDVARIHAIFRKYPNIKLCLSGHYHQVDHCRYLGVDYICGGAVCADYWRRPLTYRPEFEAGYGVVDLFPDGTFEYRFIDYGLTGYQDDPKRPRHPWGKI
jgi:3',5'-cyclic AMP phosphodiesterase CpdA